MIFIGIGFNLLIDSNSATAFSCEDDKCRRLEDGTWACVQGEFAYNCNAAGDDCSETKCTDVGSSG